MTTNPSHSVDLGRGDIAPDRPRVRPVSRAALAAARMRTGRRTFVAGSAIAVAGVVLYCVASLAGDLRADLGEIVLRNAVPYARAALAVIGLGVLVWLAGSISYLSGALDADEGDEGRGIV
jgi:hypothetical protein